MCVGIYLFTCGIMFQLQDKPAGDQDRPTGDQDRPTGDQDRSTGDQDRPTGDQDRPTGDQDRPAGDQDRPTGDQDRPTGDQDTSLPAQDRPSSAATSSAPQRGQMGTISYIHWYTLINLHSNKTGNLKTFINQWKRISQKKLLLTL